LDTSVSLVNAGLNLFYVSIDGVGKFHDEILWVKVSFERAKRALQNLVKAKGDKKSPTIICNNTVSSLNVEHFEEVAAFAEKTGVDEINFEYVTAFGSETIENSLLDGLRPNPYFVAQNFPLTLNREQAILFKQKLAWIKKLLKPKNIRVFSGNIDLLTIENLVGGIFPYEKCYFCRSHIAVDPYGNIVACPNFMNYSYGNIKNEHLRSIWNNEKHRVFRRFQEGKKLDICNYCNQNLQINSSFIESMRKIYYSARGKERV
ncbi:MAG: radical SAM protein, partial [Deltaproteobacteria bacterium]|nr:radical SAM protein [Deltaproteobacteria bacterium]